MNYKKKAPIKDTARAFLKGYELVFGDDKSEEDVTRGMEYLKLAASTGDGKAAETLGLIYRSGTETITQDFYQATIWYMKAVMNGNKRAVQGNIFTFRQAFKIKRAKA